MSFMYINCSPSESMSATLTESHLEYRYAFNSNSITAFQNKVVGDTPPIYKNDITGGIVIISGWFLIDGKLNDYKRLLYLIEISDIKSALHEVEAGIFSGCYFNLNYEGITFFQDPTALLSHYYNTEKSLEISPEASSMITGNDSLMKDFLSSQGHLYSHKTIDIKVRRILPFETLHIQSNSIISSYSPQDIIDYSFVTQSSTILNTDSHIPFENNDLPKVCALSSGFDSRFLTLKYVPQRSYTWGPLGSQDQVIARKIAASLNMKHSSFSYLQPGICNRDRDISCALFEGVVKNPMTQLIANYRYSKSLSKLSEYSLDGYLGGVFQRGSYANFGGLIGEIFKVLPKFYQCFNISEKTILKNRYSKISKDNFELLYKDYKEKTSAIKSCTYAKISFYEVFYGRGSRYMSTGGIVMNSLYYSVFAPFLSKTYLNYFFAKDFNSIVNYKQFKLLWRDNSRTCDKLDFLKSLKSEGGFSPNTPRSCIPFISLLGRINTHVNPFRKNYLRE